MLTTQQQRIQELVSAGRVNELDPGQLRALVSDNADLFQVVPKFTTATGRVIEKAPVTFDEDLTSLEIVEILTEAGRV
jgi:hypothetical protein